jgi:excisionase family DNA binding protein
MEEQTVSVIEAAKLLSVSRDTVHRLIKAGQIKAHKKTLAPRSAFQIDRTSIEAYDQRRRAPAP